MIFFPLLATRNVAQPPTTHHIPTKPSLKDFEPVITPDPFNQGK